MKKLIHTYAIFINEIQPKNNKNKTKKRLDQFLFKPLNLNSFMPKFHYLNQMQLILSPQQKERGQILKIIF